MNLEIEGVEIKRFFFILHGHCTLPDSEIPVKTGESTAFSLLLGK